jgi:hypothetical protein
VAQTRKKRQTKHRGNAAGVVEARGRTGRPPTPEERKRQARDSARATRLARPPSWKISFRNSGIMAAFIYVFLLLTDRPKHGSGAPEAIIVALVAFVGYVPLSYYIERFTWRRRMRSAAAK